VATVLVQHGVLKPGDYLVAGSTHAKVRTLTDYRGKRLTAAHPGMPVEVTGFKAVPSFGDTYRTEISEKTAREAATASVRREQAKGLVVKKIDASALTAAITAGNVKELNLVVKADVQGSLESLMDSLNKLHNDEVAVRVVHAGVGDINESDVNFAKTSGGLLIGFNVSLSSTLKALANRERVQVRLYKVIYELTDDLRDALSQMLVPETVETVVGELEIKGVFKITKGVVVCGGTVTSGRIEPKMRLRVKRGREVLGEGTLTTLQKDKQAAREAFEGETCGMSVATPAIIEMGDRLEFFTREERARTFA
jgi:translation initiation factor IF-2